MASAEHSSPQPKIKLYWLNDSAAQRFVWLLEELGLEYEVELFQRNRDMRAPPELEKVHPLGKVPIITFSFPDSHSADRPARREPLVLAESGFIAQYLCEHFARGRTLLPRRYRDGHEGEFGGETDEWLRYQYFMYYPEGSLYPPLLVALILNILKSPKIPFLIRPVTSAVADKITAGFVVPDMAKHFAFLESQLETAPGGGPYLCGSHLTAADILISFPLITAKGRVGELHEGKGEPRFLDKYPKVWAYLRRLQEEPGYKRAEAKIKELQGKS